MFSRNIKKMLLKGIDPHKIAEWALRKRLKFFHFAISEDINLKFNSNYRLPRKTINQINKIMKTKINFVKRTDRPQACIDIDNKIYCESLLCLLHEFGHAADKFCFKRTGNQSIYISELIANRNVRKNLSELEILFPGVSKLWCKFQKFQIKAYRYLLLSWTLKNSNEKCPLFLKPLINLIHNYDNDRFADDGCPNLGE